MGVVPSRQPKRRPPPPRVIKFVPEVEAGPLTTLDELLSYKDPLLCAVEPLNATIRRGRPEDPKILVCHDMMGGYHDDRFIHGGEDSGSYRFHHWQIIDTFVYYTHSLVTIPPPGWITAAHRHGVKVLGRSCCSDEHNDLVTRIQGISWVPFVKDLLAAITEKTHRAIPDSLVIWYDAVDTRGMGKPHNELNERNSCFFGLCDGIFLNFRWNEDMLQRSAQLAGDRKADVYVGVDVFARNTPYLGGFNTPQVVKTVRAHGLSSAVFGPGWVYEKRLKTNYIKNQYRKYYVEDKRGVQGATLDEIGVRLFCAGPNVNVCLLGQLDVKRPVESSAAEDPDAVAELSDVNYEPEEKRSRVHKSEESVATAETTE
ncbi:hypothetical protein V5799_015772 [Amblyomma americanum]|uniref:Cytosolic endo-beta-N-acetylglucosaminidase TIM barrel domain-containing protein n=1 Tax=Amblyomma americanum TaxID=6943 RepID=A0AAQ4F6W0_AMBAM